MENKKVESYSDGELLYYFEKDMNRVRINNILDSVYEAFERELPDCYIIQMPIGVYADVHHKWGLIDLHYCREYYEYLYKCFDMIASKDNCQQDIYKLRDNYSEILQENRDIFIHNCFSYITGKQFLKGELCYKSSDNRLVVKGANFYADCSTENLLGKTSRYLEVANVNRCFVKFR